MFLFLFLFLGFWGVRRRKHERSGARWGSRCSAVRRVARVPLEQRFTTRAHHALVCYYHLILNPNLLNSSTIHQMHHKPSSYIKQRRGLRRRAHTANADTWTDTRQMGTRFSGRSAGGLEIRLRETFEMTDGLDNGLGQTNNEVRFSATRYPGDVMGVMAVLPSLAPRIRLREPVWNPSAIDFRGSESSFGFANMKHESTKAIEKCRRLRSSFRPRS